MTTHRRPALVAGSLLIIATMATGGAALAQDASTEPMASRAPLPEFGDISGDIRIDGSSTVFPVSEAIAEEFQIAYPNVRVTVAESGTSGGFEKFCRGETDMNDASRPMKEEEIAACAEAGIEALELPVAFDGLSLVVHPSNDWVDCLTVAELNAIWDTGSTVSNWSQVREGFPDRPLQGHLFGAGADSGTFDYFTEEINGETDRIRSDFTQSEDDNTLVTGVAGDPDALGFFGYSYYAANTDKLKIVQVDGGNGCVEPNFTTIADGSYAPLSRPLFIYPAAGTLERPEVAAFLQYYLYTVNDILGLDVEAGEVAYVPVPTEMATSAWATLQAALGQ
jgi:phosphate transport system substrate-binding protein